MPAIKLNMMDETYRFSTPVQIRMSDLDPLIHVNNGAQCNFFDHGRSCYFESVFGRKIDWEKVDMVLVHIELDFYHSIYIHDSIVCESKVYELGNKSFKMIQRLKEANTGEIKTICKSIVAGFDRLNDRAIPISDFYRSKIISFEEL